MSIFRNFMVKKCNINRGKYFPIKMNIFPMPNIWNYFFCSTALPPARWHSKNTYLSSLGMLAAEPVFFPMQQPLLWNSSLNKH